MRVEVISGQRPQRRKWVKPSLKQAEVKALTRNGRHHHHRECDDYPWWHKPKYCS